ncbi:sialate O-acetylesterase [Deminuibacter soli]|uniref:Sialate O-acetylesterase n=1 Tax=Deminuibacter soli TaxID=2291815 RepID=A0A3E1NF25_9BACT|nr:sialate O-acetylesterase [Deminuibacter soli]RFM26411.1 sialate O-acetylesterase [Deminuibacter soli]
MHYLHKQWVLVLLCCGLLAQTGFAQLRLAGIFSDHVVLQREKPVPVWGWAGAGERITVRLNNRIAVTKADRLGKWRVQLPPLAAGGPYTLSVTGKGTTLQVNDVLIGEVWLCGGQSNMEWKLADVTNAGTELAAAGNDFIRQVKIPDTLSLTPLDDIGALQWTPATTATVADFTAAGYFFAKQLYNQLHVPIGLINDNWGGSQIEGWISKNAMLQSSELRGYAANLPGTWDSIAARLHKGIVQELRKTDAGYVQPPTLSSLLQPGYDYRKWPAMYVPGSWDWKGMPAYRGQGYMRRDLEVTAADCDKPALLSLGTNDSRYVLYINQVKVAAGQDSLVRIQLPAHTFKAGTNTLLLQQGAQVNPAWMGMGIHGEKAQVFISLSSQTLSLADDQWHMMPVFDSAAFFAKLNNNAGTALYNAMIHPLVPYGLRGIIWYQGESNTARAYQYRRVFPLLINSWRQEWKDSFPFLFVQLSSFGTNQSANAGSDWAELREAQLQTLALPGTAMAVTIDIGDSANIHPRNKQDVGRRLAAAAFNKVYHWTVPYSGPLYNAVSFDGDKAVVSFSYAQAGLQAKDKYGYLRGFEIAGADHHFYYARAIIAGGKVIVCSEQVRQPLAVRYGWSNAPVDANLYNADGFPASPFRTDDWPGITEKNLFE